MRRNTSAKSTFMLYRLRATSPSEAHVRNKIAKYVVNLKIKMTRRVLTVMLLQKLHRKKTGTNDIEQFCRNIKRKFAKNKMRNTMMTNKIKDAIYHENKARKLFNSRYEYFVKRWGHNRYFMSQFNTLLQEEIEFVWRTGKVKMLSKIDFLVKKWQKSDLITPEQDEIEGVAVSDKKLEEMFGPANDEPPAQSPLVEYNSLKMRPKS